MGFLDFPREEGVLSLYPVCDMSGEISSCIGEERGKERREERGEKRERNSYRERVRRKFAYTLHMHFEAFMYLSTFSIKVLFTLL